MGTGGVLANDPPSGLVCAGKFVYQKLSCVKWVGLSDDDQHQVSARFVSGSWDDERKNSLRLWQTEANGREPRELARLVHSGDVNAVEFVSDDHFLSASTDGSVRLYQCQEEAIVERQAWIGLHRGSLPVAACNDLAALADGASLSENCVSCGEDGVVHVLTVTKSKPVRSYLKADSCSLTAALFTRHDEVCVANMRGQIKVYDLRSKDNDATSTYMSSDGDQVGISCLCVHPSQRHIVCSGTKDGKLTFWDLRRQGAPLSIFHGHRQAVNAAQFHPRQPEHFFSCSEGGDVWHWNASNAANNLARMNFGNQQHQQALSFSSDASAGWFANEAVKHRVDTVELLPSQKLPVNALHARGRGLVVAGDNEAVYVLSNVFL